MRIPFPPTASPGGASHRSGCEKTPVPAARPWPHHPRQTTGAHATLKRPHYYRQWRPRRTLKPLELYTKRCRRQTQLPATQALTAPQKPRADGCASQPMRRSDRRRRHGSRWLRRRRLPARPPCQGCRSRQVCPHPRSGSMASAMHSQVSTRPLGPFNTRARNSTGQARRGVGGNRSQDVQNTHGAAGEQPAPCIPSPPPNHCIPPPSRLRHAARRRLRTLIMVTSPAPISPIVAGSGTPGSG